MVKYVKGNTDLSSVELQVSNEEWLPMHQLWGATWKVDLPTGAKGPFSIKLTLDSSNKTIVAKNVIPVDWNPAKSYPSLVNFD